MEEQTAHDALVDAIDLTYLGQLQRTRGAGQEETDNDKDGIVDNAHRHILGHERQHRCHDQGRQEHAADEACHEEFAANSTLLRVLIQGFLRQRVAGQVGSEHDEDQGNSDATRLGDGTCDRVGDEGSVFEKEPLQRGDRGDNDGKEHGPERWVHKVPETGEEARDARMHGSKEVLQW